MLFAYEVLFKNFSHVAPGGGPEGFQREEEPGDDGSCWTSQGAWFRRKLLTFLDLLIPALLRTARGFLKRQHDQWF